MDGISIFDNTIRTLKDRGWVKGDYVTYGRKHNDIAGFCLAGALGATYELCVAKQHESNLDDGYAEDLVEQGLRSSLDELKTLCDAIVELFPNRLTEHALDRYKTPVEARDITEYTDDIDIAEMTKDSYVVVVACFNDHHETTLDDVVSVLIEADGRGEA